MRDFPVFTTEYGVASLILKEVPYRQEAYIVIQSSEEPKELLAECIGFCRMVGAEKIYVRGHAIAEDYPLHNIIYRMRGEITADEELLEHLWPVTEETVSRWREYMNEKMRAIDNSVTLEKREEKDILSQGGAYFVHRAGQLYGAGWLVEDELKLIAAERGKGMRVLHTLLSAENPEQLQLEVASTNARALRFYEKLGLIKTAEVYRWYRVL